MGITLSMRTIRRTLPLLLTSAVGFFLMFSFFVIQPTISLIEQTLLGWTTTIAGFAMILGISQLLLRNADKIRKRAPGEWYFCAYSVSLALIMIFVGLAYGQQSALFTSIVNNFLTPCTATIFALMLFTDVDGAYRGFRARSLESAVMFVIVIVQILALAPWGQVVFPPIAPMMSWISAVPVTAGTRGIVMAGALGAIALCLRTMFAQERGFLGER